MHTKKCGTSMKSKIFNNLEGQSQTNLILSHTMGYLKVVKRSVYVCLRFKRKSKETFQRISLAYWQEIQILRDL